MTSRRLVWLAPLALALATAGCGRSAKEEAAGAYCPRPFSVQDADRLTRFRAGAGRDPRDVVFDAALLGSSTTCSIKGNVMEVLLVIRMSANAGPALGNSGVTSVPYFVRVLDQGNRVAQGFEDIADFRLTPTKPRASGNVEVTVKLPFARPSDLASYGIAVGLKPTPEELQYNRRAAAR
ncbi:MAG TPA: hypothetical protein VMI56_00915 [Reyranella sp.]|nr:hypothetical protein [Reyranella sp.]